MNPEEFIAKLESIFSNLNLTPSMFADQIGVQRSSISHLLSGRNKPSLDFIIKVIEVFPEVDLYWILNGKGNFPKSENATQTVLKEEKKASTLSFIETTNSEPDLFSTVEKGTTPTLSESNPVESIKTENNSHEEIERIVVFFKNGTFKNYKP